MTRVTLVAVVLSLVAAPALGQHLTLTAPPDTRIVTLRAFQNLPLSFHDFIIGGTVVSSSQSVSCDQVFFFAKDFEAPNAFQINRVYVQFEPCGGGTLQSFVTDLGLAGSGQTVDPRPEVNGNFKAQAVVSGVPLFVELCLDVFLPGLEDGSYSVVGGVVMDGGPVPGITIGTSINLSTGAVTGPFTGAVKLEFCEIVARANNDDDVPDLIRESFTTTPVGNVPPLGWTSTLATGIGGQDGWRWDNLAAVEEGLPFFAPSALCDATFAGLGVNALLDTPTFDASTAPAVFLRWRQWHAPIGSTALVRVSDGAIISTVYLDTLGTDYGEEQVIDITAAAGGSPIAFVRFEFTSPAGGGWWRIDDVRVEVPASGLDVGVSRIVAPRDDDPAACASSAGVSTVTIEVESYGSVSPGGGILNLSYQATGLPPVVEIIPVPPGTMFPVTYTFATPLVWPSTPFRLEARATGDAFPSNDAVAILVDGPVTGLTVEDFEDTTFADPTTPPRGWINDDSDVALPLGNADWRFRRSPTPTSGTGPAADFTTGVPGEGAYAYVEDDGDYSTIRLLTPCIETTLGAPHLAFRVHSRNDATPTTMGENFLSVDVIDASGALCSPDVVGPIGHLGPDWEERCVDLSAFAAMPVRLAFRASTGGGFATHDIAIDEVRVFDPFLPGPGQAPGGDGLLDVNRARNADGAFTSSLEAGPYFATIPLCGVVGLCFEGAPLQPIIFFGGPLNPGVVAFPFGQVDVGNPDGLGGVMNIEIFGDGTGGGLGGLIYRLGPTGKQTVSFTATPGFQGVVIGLQAIMFGAANPFGIAISNAVEISIQ